MWISQPTRPVEKRSRRDSARTFDLELENLQWSAVIWVQIGRSPKNALIVKSIAWVVKNVQKSRCACFVISRSPVRSRRVAPIFFRDFRSLSLSTSGRTVATFVPSRLLQDHEKDPSQRLPVNQFLDRMFQGVSLNLTFNFGRNGLKRKRTGQPEELILHLYRVLLIVIYNDRLRISRSAFILVLTD